MQEINLEQLETPETPRIAWIEVKKAINLIYDRNPKQHDLGGICESIKKYGWQELPKYDEQLGAIKAGNGRIAAIAQMEESGESIPRGAAKHKETGSWIIPILCGIDAVSGIEAKGYLIDSNNLTLMGGDFTALDISRAYDNSYLDLLEELANEDALPVSIDGDDLDLLLQPEDNDGSEGQEDEDAIAKAVEKAESGELESRVKEGEIWALDKHRIACGDSTNKNAVAFLFSERQADMIFSDPPYNVGYDAEARHSTFSDKRRQNKLGTIDNDKMSSSEFKKFLDKVYASFNVAVKPGRGIYIFHADSKGHFFRNAFIDVGWKLQSCLIWKKSSLCLGRSDYQWIHEPILYGWKPGESHVWYGDRKQTTVIEFPTDHYNKKESDTDGYVHPTQKPTNIIRYLAGNSTKKGEMICDLFLGSGSTIIAAQQTGRIVYGFELSPHYCEVIIQRWENFTGKKAEFAGYLPSSQ